jgi:hypothetical protein
MKEESRDDDALPVKLATENPNSSVVAAARNFDSALAILPPTYWPPQTLPLDLDYAMHQMKQREKKNRASMSFTRRRPW